MYVVRVVSSVEYSNGSDETQCASRTIGLYCQQSADRVVNKTISVPLCFVCICGFIAV